MNDFVTKHLVSLEAENERNIKSFAKYLKEFERSLDENHEMYVFTNNFYFRLEKLKHENEIVICYGSDSGGAPTVLLQHSSQLNVSLLAVQKREPEKAPIRIGFELD